MAVSIFFAFSILSFFFGGGGGGYFARGLVSQILYNLVTFYGELLFVSFL